MSTPYKADLQRQFTELEGFCTRQKVRIDGQEKELKDLRDRIAEIEALILGGIETDGPKPPEIGTLTANAITPMAMPRPIPLEVRTMRFDDPTWG